jgi:mannose-6-phosphate isomerase-like protein (cupin superfamily)
MFTASYTSTETTTEAETKRMFNVLWERRQGHDTDFSITVERGEPGSWFRAHAHDLEQIFFVVEGRMEITIDGETRVIGPREMVYVPRNATHSARHVEGELLEYLVINHWPKDSADRLGF